MSTATLPAALNRHRVNTAVIESPALTMPKYAGYATRYALVTGSTCLTSPTPDLNEVLDKIPVWGQKGARIVHYALAPLPTDGYGDRGVGTPPWAGGTWNGSCGSTLWVRDPDLTYAGPIRLLNALTDGPYFIQDVAAFANDLPRLTQVWWINGNSADRNPATDGFYVECQQRYRHLGDCQALDLTWDWRDYAPWVESAQLSLF